MNTDHLSSFLTFTITKQSLSNDLDVKKCSHWLKTLKSINNHMIRRVENCNENINSKQFGIKGSKTLFLQSLKLKVGWPSG